MTLHNAILAAPGDSAFFQADNIRGLLLLVAGFIIIFVGIGMAGKSNKGRLKDQADTFGSVILAIVVVALGATMAFVAFGESILNFVIGG